VDLISDPSQDAEDQYGRLLAYVQPSGITGPSFQELILTAGLARVYVYDRHPFRRVSLFRAAADVAQKNHSGVWADCGGNFRRPLT
jgi:endonuclease YncB( thermonuclease family)